MGEPAARGAGLRAWTVFLLRRLGLLVVVLWMVATIAFGVTRATGTPLYAAVGQQVTQEMIEARARLMGLDQPQYRQYLDYLAALARGDLGSSRRTFVPVADEIRDRLPATAELVTAAIVLSLLWAVPLGIAAARRPRGIAARVGEGLAQFGVSVPAFWLGLLLIFVLYFVLSVVPAPLGRVGLIASPPPRVTGLYAVDAILARDGATLAVVLRHLLLPALTLSITSAPPIFRVTRTAVAEALRSPYVEAARSYGLSERLILRRHVLRNAFPPVLNLTAMTFGYLIGGAVLVEVVFSWPGIGSYAVRAMDFSDYDAVLGVVIVSAAIYATIYFLVDLLQYAADPRLRD
jgi:ABC-type dipeptide/oligopeptide/nickel transport system permease component